MRTIWKFGLEVTGRQSVTMPADAEILSVQVQAGVPCLWALVSPDAPGVPRTVDTYGTGHPVDGNPGRYIGTYQLSNGGLVFHVFTPEVAS